MIHTLNTGVAEITAVGLPEGADNFVVSSGGKLCFHANRIEVRIPLPPGRYTYLCTLNTATEEQAFTLVGFRHNMLKLFVEGEAQLVYKNYITGAYYCKTALESLRSLFADLNYHDIAILLKEK